MDKLASIRVPIAVGVVAVLGVGASVQAATARPCDPDCIVVPKLKPPNAKRLPSEPTAPAWAQFIRVPGTNRYHAKSVHGGLDD